MKQIKIIHINDGTHEERINGNRHFVEEYTYSEKIIQKYLDAGFELKSVCPDITPAYKSEGNISFYKTGFTYFLVRESDELFEEDLIEDFFDNY